MFPKLPERLRRVGAKSPYRVEFALLGVLRDVSDGVIVQRRQFDLGGGASG